MSGDLDDPAQDLTALEVAVDAGDAEAARLALRRYLFGVAGRPVDGSAVDAVAALAQAPAGRAIAAAVVLRSLAAGVLADGRGGQLARHVVALGEGALPQLCDFLGIDRRAQNHEKLDRLRAAHEKILGILQPLRTPYAELDTLVGAKPRLTAALQHSQVRGYCRPWRVDEVAELVSRLLGSLARVLRMDAGFEADLEASRREIASGLALVVVRPSFLASELRAFLENADRALDAFLIAMQGRFVAKVVRADREGADLQKRYPLHEAGRELRVVIPFRNEGPGPALDVVYKVSSPDAWVVVDDQEQVLGEIAPGEFGVPVDVLVAEPGASLTLEVELGWREVGELKAREELFGARALAQRSDVDWASLKYWNPYSTEPAEGAGFYGRKEQVGTLVARFLQRPMEPSYVTGQKRVGKTSLARTAMAEARNEDPGSSLTTGEVLWGRVAHEDPRRALRQLGEAMERVVVGGLEGERPPKGDYDGTLAPLLDLLDLARERDPGRRYAVFIDEFDEMPEALWLQGNLAVTLFGNIRALTTTPNFCLLLVGGENMPFVMERQGARLNKFNRINLTYFSRTDEFDDFARMVRGPSEGVLTWHADAVSAVFNMTNGNPYFSKIICKQVAARAVAERDGDITAREVERAVTAEDRSLRAVRDRGGKAARSGGARRAALPRHRLQGRRADSVVPVCVPG